MATPIPAHELAADDASESRTLEWVEPDGRGGYASGLVNGAPARRYHGLLLVARTPPHDRVMLLNHLEEEVEGEPGSNVVRLTEAILEGGKARSSAPSTFSPRPVPCWSFEVQGARIRRWILRPRGTNHLVVRWELDEGAEPLKLRVRPMLTFRHDHDVRTENTDLITAANEHESAVIWQPYPDFPALQARHSGHYRHDPGWRHGIHYPIDHERGEDSREDWWCPGEFEMLLSPGRAVSMVFSTDDASTLDGDRLYEEERARRIRPKRESGSPLFDVLCEHADTYLAEFPEGSAVLAGYPWFDVWTRDTFTAFTGLYLATGRFDEARKTLSTFAPLVRDGMLPANLPLHGVEARYNSADASLWFIHSIGRYLEVTGETSWVENFAWDALRAIIQGYLDGAPRHISVAADGLVFASAPDQALTWMDADYKGKVMTPRRGKPVELQALWVRSLRVSRRLAEGIGDDAFAKRCEDATAAAIASFRARFWCEERGYLFDLIDGPNGDDATFRPNQIFALSLDDEMVPRERALRVLEVVTSRLLTPVGLRTLPSDDPAYHPRYEGDQAHRDPAYHQGTVWPYLLGPFVRAWVRLHGDGEAVRAKARHFFDGLEWRIDHAGCVGHISEIFDAEPPHRPRGCFAQAWSIGEVLSALWEVVLGAPGSEPPSRS